MVDCVTHNQLKVNNMYGSKGVANDVLDNQAVISSNARLLSDILSIHPSLSYNWITTKVVTTRHIETCLCLHRIVSLFYLCVCLTPAFFVHNYLDYERRIMLLIVQINILDFAMRYRCKRYLILLLGDIWYSVYDF